MQVDMSRSLLARRGAAFSPSTGCFSIEDLRGLYAVQLLDFRSISAPPPRGHSGARCNGAPLFNPRSSEEDSEEEDDEEFEPTLDMLRKVKTHIPRTVGKLHRGVFRCNHDADSDDSSNDTDDSDDEEFGCSADMFRRSSTQTRRRRLNPSQRGTREKQEICASTPDLGHSPAAAPRAQSAAQRSCIRSPGEGVVSAPGPETSPYLEERSELYIAVPRFLGSPLRPSADGNSSISAQAQPMVRAGERGPSAAPRVGLGLVHSASCDSLASRRSAATSAWAELPGGPKAQDEAEETIAASMKGPCSPATRPQGSSPSLRQHVLRHQPASLGGVANVLGPGKLRAGTADRPKGTRLFPLSPSVPNSKPPMSPGLPPSSSTPGTSPSSLERASRHSSPCNLQNSSRAFVKCHSEMERRGGSMRDQPAKGAPRVLARAQSESERSLAKPKSILVRNNGLARTSSLGGRRVSFSNEVGLFVYHPQK